MSIAVTCSGCNRTMKVKDDFAGKRALCPFCKAEVRVPQQEQPLAVDEYALAADAPDDHDEKPRRKPRLRDDEDDRDDKPARKARLRDDEDDFEEKPRRKARPRDDEDELEEKPRRKARLRDVEDELDARKKRSGGGVQAGSVLTGILMMVGALIWFFGALALGKIFVYPPILFIIGLVTFIKGLAGGSD